MGAREHVPRWMMKEGPIQFLPCLSIVCPLLCFDCVSATNTFAGGNKETQKEIQSLPAQQVGGAHYYFAENYNLVAKSHIATTPDLVR